MHILITLCNHTTDTPLIRVAIPMKTLHLRLDRIRHICALYTIYMYIHLLQTFTCAPTRHSGIPVRGGCGSTSYAAAAGITSPRRPPSCRPADCPARGPRPCAPRPAPSFRAFPAGTARQRAPPQGVWRRSVHGSLPTRARWKAETAQQQLETPSRQIRHAL